VRWSVTDPNDRAARRAKATSRGRSERSFYRHAAPQEGGVHPVLEAVRWRTRYGGKWARTARTAGVGDQTAGTEPGVTAGEHPCATG